jgi:methylglutaconyl-CoA hydratase
MSDAPFHTKQRADGVAWLTLNRPEVHNAFDDGLIRALTAELLRLARQETVRAVVLTGAGKSFSAGADLAWMRRTADYAEAENLADAKALAQLMQVLNELPLPTVARVNGAALGGGVGLVAACDIAIAADHARFGTTEVRLGLIPAVIGPYVVAAIGQRQARRLMLTGERIDAAAAQRLGLVHEVVPADELDQAVEAVLAALLAGGPRALSAAKRLVLDLAGRPLDAALIEDTAGRIARLRAAPEGKEGVGAFLDKRPPAWQARG